MTSNPAASLARRLAELPDRLRAEAAAALAEVGNAMLAEARRRLAVLGPQPSGPGEAPHDPNGRLAASLVARPDPEAGTVTVAAEAPHAAFLEYGTRRMAPRPFLRPAGEAVRPAAVDLCRAALARAARSLKDPA